MILQDTIDLLERKVENVFISESSGHDIYHLKRTLKLALQIQKQEGGDPEVIAISALLHDLHRIISKKNKKYCSPKESLSAIDAILKCVGLEEKIISKVLHCIEYHEQYSFSSESKSVFDIETLILQDADNLDAIGAIGIARVFAFGGANNLSIWNPEIPIERTVFEDSQMDHSSIHHFYSKLLKIKETMNTETGKRLAEKRHIFLNLYLKEFFEEWNGLK
jgi:uncharacterized protein